MAEHASRKSLELINASVRKDSEASTAKVSVTWQQYWLGAGLQNKHRLCFTRVARNSLTTDKPVASGFPIELEFRTVGWNCSTGEPLEKKNRSKGRTNNKLNPHVTPSPGIKPEPHWWDGGMARTLAECVSVVRDMLWFIPLCIYQNSCKGLTKCLFQHVVKINEV